MGAEKTWWAKLLVRFLPQQKSSGDSALQIGKVDGAVTINNVTNHHVVHHPASPPVSRKPQATEEQKKVLAMIRRLRNTDSVFAFMEREFKTRMVIDLRPDQLLRVSRYVEAILRSTQEEKT